MADAEKLPDLGDLSFHLPAPSAEHVARELVGVITDGLVPRDIEARQRGTGFLYVLPLLSSVQNGAHGGRGGYERLCRVIQHAAGDIADPDVRAAALDIVGEVNVRAPIGRRTLTAAERQGYDKPDSWYRKARNPLILAIAQKIVDDEHAFRDRTGVEALAERRTLAPQLAVDWLARLEEYKGMAEELDCLLGDLANWDRHLTGERVLGAESIELL